MRLVTSGTFPKMMLSVAAVRMPTASAMRSIDLSDVSSQCWAALRDVGAVIVGALIAAVASGLAFSRAY